MDMRKRQTHEEEKETAAARLDHKMCYKVLNNIDPPGNGKLDSHMVSVHKYLVCTYVRTYNNNTLQR